MELIKSAFFVTVFMFLILIQIVAVHIAGGHPISYLALVAQIATPLIAPAQLVQAARNLLTWIYGISLSLTTTVKIFSLLN